MARQVDIVLTLNAAGVVTGGKAGEAAVKGIAQQAKQTQKAIEGVGRSARKTGRDLGQTMRSGRRGALALNRVVQDLPFGFIAIQNNITEVAASFTTMRQNGLSAAQSMKAIVDQFKGPGGFLFLISAATSLLVVFGGKIIKAFQEGRSSAEDFAKALDKVLEIERELQKLRISAVDVAASIIKTQGEINRLNTLASFRAAQLSKQTGILTVSVNTLTKAEKARLLGAEAILKRLKEEEKLTGSLALQQKLLVKVGAERVANIDDQSKALERLLDIERKVKKIRIEAVDVPASIARAEAEISRLQNIEFETSQLTKAESKRLEGITELLKQLKEESDLTEELALAQELLVLVGGQVVEKQEKITTAFERMQQAVKDLTLNLQSMESAGLPALIALRREAIRLQGSLNEIERLIGAIADPQKVPAAPGIDTFKIADRLKQEQMSARIQLREFTDEQISEFNRLEIALGESASNINLLMAALAAANSEVLQDTFGNFAQALETIGAESLGIYKGFAIAEAVAATWLAANKALASAPPPFNFVLMASVIAVGLANVAKIAAAGKGSGASSGGGGAAAQATSSTPAAFGGLRVQDRGFTTGALGSAQSARAPEMTIRVVEPDLFKLNVELSNADNIRAQVGNL